MKAEVNNQTKGAVTETYRNEFASIPYSVPFRKCNAFETGLIDKIRSFG